MHTHHQKLVSLLKAKYGFSEDVLQQRVSPHLVSMFELTLPRSVLEKAQAVVRDLHRLTQSPSYIRWVDQQTAGHLSRWPSTPSMLCSLDVHVLDNGEIKIIEINTNASSFLIGCELYESRHISTFPEARQDLKSAIRSMLPKKEKLSTLIVDENPQQQNLWIEFAMFKSFFETELGLKAEIADVKDLILTSDKKISYQQTPIDFIYNRHTDFKFEQHAALLESYIQHGTVISPNPRGYELLADKKRLVEYSGDLLDRVEAQENIKLAALRGAILETKKFSEFSSMDDLWSKRSKYFFKPPNMFGGKSVYRGKSISRTVFQRIYEGEYIAQEYAPPGEFTGQHDGQELKFKYDLRFYFFADRIHMGLARLYQGQLTNLQTLYGGLTPLKFTD
ncbi:MAG: hypothetical protein K2Q26_02025 [Bdellovibrionales bacterium]|nr:hypothetical protein [Bdellovibrionales bacterium]